MDELSLYILDITMNSVRAGATEISITLTQDNEYLTFSVTDNGCGMTKEQLERLSNPFFTTRTTRNRAQAIAGVIIEKTIVLTNGFLLGTGSHTTKSSRN